MALTEILPTAIPGNVFDTIKLGMPLLSAEHDGRVNTMTVNWGQMGYLWNRCVTTVYVRPQRFTLGLMEQAGGYSLSFLDRSKYAAEILYCGQHSGRAGDKLAHCGLTVERHGEIPYLEQAGLVLICRKLYAGVLSGEQFLDPAIVGEAYPAKDFHKMYIGEIITALQK